MTPSTSSGQAILTVAARSKGQPYALPPDGVTTTDCSLYVLRVLREAGYPLADGARTAEQIRQVAAPVPFSDVQPGDLLFFERTYDAPGPAGPDGRIASHVGISLGRGTKRMWDANDARGNVGITDISSSWWQSRLFEARRSPAMAGEDTQEEPIPNRSRTLRLNAASVRLRAFPGLRTRILVEDLGLGTLVSPVDDYDWREVRTPDGQTGWVASRYLDPVEDEDPDEDGLSREPDHQFSFEELWPHIETDAAIVDANPQVMAAVIAQESSFKNWRVHHDGTGHGLIGLDDNGLLPAFEAWSGLTIGRGADAALIPPGIQIAYLAKTLAEYANRLDGPYQAARAWHRGEGLWHDVLGTRYERLIRAHVARLFG